MRYSNGKNVACCYAMLRQGVLTYSKGSGIIPVTGRNEEREDAAKTGCYALQVPAYGDMVKNNLKTLFLK